MKNRLIFLLPFTVGLACIIVGSILDLKIAESIFTSSTNIFSLIMAGIGCLPMFLGLAFSGGFLYRKSIIEITNKIGKIFFCVLGIIGFGVGAYFAGKEFISVNALGAICAIFLKNKWLFIGIFGILFCTPLFILGLYYGKKYPGKKLFYIALIACLITGISILICTITKSIVHRCRFRSIIDSSYELKFTNWWQINKDYSYGLSLGYGKEEFKSFPSGHSCNSLLVTMFVPYIGFLSAKIKKHQTLIFALSFIWTVVVMFSRMLCGAHFMSDVGMGVVIATSVYFLVNEVILHIDSSEKLPDFWEKFVS